MHKGYTSPQQYEQPEHVGLMRCLPATLARATLLALLAGGTSTQAVDFDGRDEPAALETLARDLTGKLADPAQLPDLTRLGANLRQRLLDPESFGIPADVTDPTVGYDDGAYAPLFVPGRLPSGIRQTADRLLTDGPLGQPGKVDWDKVKGRFGAGAIQPLALAYLETGDDKYLYRWCAYLDDWSLRERADFWPIQCPPEHSKGAPATWHLVKLWGGIARRLAEHPERFPTAAMLRCLNKVLPEYPLMSMVHHRGNPRNWTVENAHFYCALGFFLDDFTVGRELLREGVRVIESYAVTHNMRDGTENQHMLGYNLMYLHGTGKMAALWEAAGRTGRLSPDANLLSERPFWRELLQANARDRAIRMIRMVTPEGRGPSSLRTDLRDYPLGGITRMFPEKALDPPSQAIVQWFRSGKKSPPPSITSEHFPYGGYTTLRSGWGPENSHGFFFSAPQPGATAGFNSERNNNALTIAAFGDDLIVAGDRGAYTKRPSPLRVDGREQAFHLGLMAPLAAWDEPSQTLFHSAENFVLAEGIYTGPYGKRPPLSTSPDVQRKATESALNGISHTRVVVLLKPSTWLIFDRVNSPGPRECTLDWHLPLLPVAGRQPYRAFRPEDIEQPNAPLAEILARRPGGTHARMTFAATAPIRLQRQEERRRGEKAGAPVSDFLRVSASWRQQETGGIITLIQPWRGDTAPEPPEDMTNDRQIGLAVPLPGGSSLVVRMARADRGPLDFGSLKSDARLLVVQETPTQELHGLLLGCHSLRWQGAAQNYPTEDFAFLRRNNGQWTFQEISRPVATVRVHPARALLERGEKITLSCPTPGVEIHYTLDGSPVTRESPRYVSPFLLEGTLFLRARAFRSGTGPHTDWEQNTLSSPETRAILRKVATHFPAITVDQPIRAGWHERSGRGSWSALWLGGDGGPSGPDTVSSRAAVMKIPQTGVYTFYAPETLTHDNQVGGYDLRLNVDGHPWFPETQRHAFGTWSVPLEKGLHRITIRWVDFRRDAVARFNQPHARLNPIWDGVRPEILLSGPDLPNPQPIPKNWIFQEPGFLEN